jgi:hypothetical protein
MFKISPGVTGTIAVIEAPLPPEYPGGFEDTSEVPPPPPMAVMPRCEMPAGTWKSWIEPV